MGSFIDYLYLGFTSGVTNVSSLFTYFASCIDGTCSDIPPEVLTVFSDTSVSLSSLPSYLLSNVSKLFYGLFDYLPDGGGFPSAFHDAALYFGDALATINFILPVSTLIYCISFILTVKFAIWAFHLIRVVFSAVRGISVDRPNI